MRDGKGGDGMRSVIKKLTCIKKYFILQGIIDICRVIYSRMVTRFLFPSVLLLAPSMAVQGQHVQVDGLKIDLLRFPDIRVANGYPVSGALTGNEELTFIRNKQPQLSWELASGTDVAQSAYQIILSDNLDRVDSGIGDWWDSGKVVSPESVNVLYRGKELKPEKAYFWRVRVWDTGGLLSDWSPVCQFQTADTLRDYQTAFYPLQKTDRTPGMVERVGDVVRADFGKAAFGQLRLTLTAENPGTKIIVRLGEAISQDGSLNRKPGGTIRYAEYPVSLRSGEHTYLIRFHPNKRNTNHLAVKMPGYIGEVFPFRYVEIEGYPRRLDANRIVRSEVNYPFDDYASYFNSSDSVLNAVWELCKYSVKAVSFAGIYMDGDRERIPYEADAHVNQLSHYCVDKEYSMARRSLEYLIFRGTWFTDCILQTVPMAYNDYLFTGDIRSAKHHYAELKAKLLLPLREHNGLISTRTGKQSEVLMKSIHALRNSMSDLVDWPHSKSFGQTGKGETDGFVFTTYNTVVNALHYKALCDMFLLAGALENHADAAYFRERAAGTKKAFQSLLWDKARKIFRDGIDTDHASLHSNMMALAFGLVPEEYENDVMDFIRSRGMACGPYSTLFLMDAIYHVGDADYGLSLLTSQDERSWYNMIRTGSTITMEAWDNKYKSNLDWNHGWGTVPASAIPRKLMGIEPLEPGFKKIRIKPQPSGLQRAEIKFPTIRGDLQMSFENKPGQSFVLNLKLPGNTTSDIYLPYWSRSQKVTLNGHPIKYRAERGFAVIENVGSGVFSFEVKK